MDNETREYRGRDITVTFDIPRCIHAEACVHGLGAVFDRDRRPWVAPDAASAEEVAEVVLRCPTGALKYAPAGDLPAETPPAANTVTVERDGPLYVHGDLHLVTREGETLLRDTRVALCRCGASANKPFCDGSHAGAGFADAAAAGAGPLAEEEDGPHGTLTVTVAPNGALISSGRYTVVGCDGSRTHHVRGSWCRCGASSRKPFCDAAHKAIGFTTD